MALNVSKTVIDYLTTRTEEKFIARQIAEWLFIRFPETCQAKKSNSKTITTDAAMTFGCHGRICQRGIRLPALLPVRDWQHGSLHG